jgi:hypothetical protein
MKHLLVITLFSLILGNANVLCQSGSQRAISRQHYKRGNLSELYRIMDSVRKVRNKGKPTTMWIDDRPISNERYRLESKTMWIEDSMMSIQKSPSKNKRGSAVSSRTSSFKKPKTKTKLLH